MTRLDPDYTPDDGEDEITWVDVLSAVGLVVCGVFGGGYILLNMVGLL